MANRAYLYTHSSLDFPAERPEDYYDSRHSIPIAWFFFFDLTHIRLDPVGSWWELRCAARKADAIAYYELRYPLLEPYVIDDQLRTWSQQIVTDLRKREGDFLLMDPGEVIDGDDERQYARFRSIARALATGNEVELRSQLALYCEQLSADSDRRLCQVFGYTYS